MSTANSRNNQPLNPDDLNRFIDNARSSFAAYKQNASAAAANAYLLWCDTQAFSATKEGKEWIKKEIEARNEAIKKNNEDVKKEKKYVVDYKDGKLSPDELVNQTGKTKEQKDEIAEEKKRLDALVKKDDKYWESLKLVPIERREGASEFTEIVKFVFEFDKSTHAAMVSRFCLVLAWIHARFKGKQIEEVNEIVTAIENAGGFEIVMEEQRNTRDAEDTDREDREFIAERNYSDTKAALKGASALATLEIEPRFEQDGLVIMVARYDGGKAHVVAELPAGDGEFKRLISRYENPELLPVPDTTEFIGRLMELGALVSDGEGSGGEDGKDKTERLLLSDGKAGKPELVISARNADAAIIVKARPRADIDLGLPDEPLFMKDKWRKALEKKINTYERRRLIDFTYDLKPIQKDGKTPAEASMAWAACNSALKEKNRASAIQQFYWYPVSKLESRPLEPSHFEPSVRFTLKPEEVRTVYRGPLKAWEESKDSAKTSKLVSLKKDGNSLYLTIKEGDSITVGTENAQGPTTVARFRPRDTANLFSLLTQQHGSEYRFELDDTGLLMVAWEDKFAAYEVYLPTATKDGRLESRRVAPMRINLPQAAE